MINFPVPRTVILSPPFTVRETFLHTVELIMTSPAVISSSARFRPTPAMAAVTQSRRAEAIVTLISLAIILSCGAPGLRVADGDG